MKRGDDISYIFFLSFFFPPPPFDRCISAEEKGTAASYKSGEDDRRDSKNHLPGRLLHVPHVFLHPLQRHFVDRHERRRQTNKQTHTHTEPGTFNRGTFIKYETRVSLFFTWRRRLYFNDRLIKFGGGESRGEQATLLNVVGKWCLSCLRSGEKKERETLVGRERRKERKGKERESVSKNRYFRKQSWCRVK